MMLGVFLWRLAACTPAGPDTAHDTWLDDTDHTGDTDDPNDVDGDGFTPGDGDCDDAEATVFPGAEELTDDGVDQDCDGSDIAPERLGEGWHRLDGSAERMTFGEQLHVESAGPWPPAVLISETAYQKSEYGGDGTVGVYSAEGIPSALRTTTLRHEAGATFGQAVGSAFLADGSRVWLAGFTDLVDLGGFCAWADTHTGDVSTGAADACIPPFEEQATDRAAWGFFGEADVDGDGFLDLLTSGMTAVAGERVGALWLTPGPLDFAQLATPPDLHMAGQVAFPHPSIVGDLDQDGYSEIALTDGDANGLADGAGAVYILPGGLPFPTATDGLAAVVGESLTASAGAAVAAPDMDGDGVPELCVSAPLDDDAGTRAGRVGCFFGPIVGQVTLTDAERSWAAEAPNAFFGFSLAALDLEGDGDDELAIGTPHDPYFGALQPGKLYLVDLDAPTRLFVGTSGDLFGFTAAAGDLDEDGRDDLVVGAPLSDAARGAAWVGFGGAEAW